MSFVYNLHNHSPPTPPTTPQRVSFNPIITLDNGYVVWNSQNPSNNLSLNKITNIFINFYRQVIQQTDGSIEYGVEKALEMTKKSLQVKTIYPRTIAILHTRLIPLLPLSLKERLLTLKSLRQN